MMGEPGVKQPGIILQDEPGGGASEGRQGEKRSENLVLSSRRGGFTGQTGFQPTNFSGEISPLKFRLPILVEKFLH